MFNQDHTPYVDLDGWQTNEDGMSLIGKRVKTDSLIEHPTINLEFANAISGKDGIVEAEKSIPYNALKESVLVRFDLPIPHMDGSATTIESAWIPRQFVSEIAP